MKPLRRLLKRVVSKSNGGQSLRTLSSVSAYALWAENYPPHAHNLLMQTEESTMQAMMPALDEKCVLDLACGSGRYSRIAIDSNAKQVIGVDNSFDMLNTGQGAFKQSPKPQFVLGTTESISLQSNTIDVVLCGLALGHLPRLKPSLHEISRVLRQGGMALVSDFHPFLFLNGKQRTFTASNGEVFAVEHYPHLYSDYTQAVHDAGLTIDNVQEPQINIDGVQVPAVIVYQLRKD